MDEDIVEPDEIKTYDPAAELELDVDLSGTGWPLDIRTIPAKKGTGKRGRVVEWIHPTRSSHAESKTRRQMAARSRKINRKK